MYHDIVDKDNGSDLDPAQYGELTKDEFKAHLIAIKESCRAVSVEEAIAEIKHGGGLKENSVAITFDDGYASAYEIAFPLLRKYGLSATIYLPTDWINGKLTLWWQDLTDMILAFETNESNISELKKISGKMKIELPDNLTTDNKSRMIFREGLSHELMKIGDDHRSKIMDDLRCVLFGDAAYKRREIRSITWEQIAEMADAGIEFGAHTCSHINLSHADLELARKEIVCSKKEIENHLGREIRGFAYPYGYDVLGYAKIAPLLEELGFDYACTSWWGNNNNESNLFLLNRNNLPPLKSSPLIKRELYINLSE
jgi:peptidoglycan/xylan/chitin deacetylase (PgdA/CDA1 family)